MFGEVGHGEAEEAHLVASRWLRGHSANLAVRPSESEHPLPWAGLVGITHSSPSCACFLGCWVIQQVFIETWSLTDRKEFTVK